MSTLWTIQPAEVLRRIQADGQARVDRRRLLHVPEAYRWLTRELRKRVPGYRGGLPWWFACEKPDLRQHRHSWVRGKRLVRIEVKVDEQRVLAFPSWAWHLVYSGEFLALSADEYRGWEKTLRRACPDEDTWPLPEPWRRRLERSWKRLFGRLPDRPWPGYRRLVLPCPEGRTAVLERILAADVREVTRFRGASRNPALLALERSKRRLLEERSPRRRA